jgi:hypothetical protein
MVQMILQRKNNSSDLIFWESLIYLLVHPRGWTPHKYVLQIKFDRLKKMS